MPKIRMKNIIKMVDKKKGIKNLNLTINDGEYVVFLGPTGHGKTTTMRILAGIVKAKEGQIFINDDEVTNYDPEDRNIGFVFEQFALFPHLDVLKNVIYGPRVRGQNLKMARKTGEEFLLMLLLGKRMKANPEELSGGMKQRVGIARALNTGSKLILMDEPYGALDAKVRRSLRTEIRRLSKDLGLTVIHATHDIYEAMEVADKIAIFKDGQIIQYGSPLEVYNKPKNIFIALFLGETNLFEGIVEKIKKDELKIRLENQGLVTAKNTGKFKINDKVVCIVRAENIKFTTSNYNGVNIFNGKIERKLFYSGFSRYQIEIEDGEQKIIVSNFKNILGDKKINDEIIFYFLPKDILVYDYPEQGLEEVLKYV
ncbi:MAG: ABC transporter ATP-binding protein [Candidatus Ranarchaeia archaeon]